MKKLATLTAASAPTVGLLATFMLLGGGQAIADHAACTFTVMANASIQNAVDGASGGDVVCLEGNFINQNVVFSGTAGADNDSNIALSETPDKIAKLTAKGGARPAGSGITLQDGVTDVIIELLAIKGYRDNGILIEFGSNSNTVRDNSTKANGEDGVQVRSDDNTLDDNSMKANGANGIHLTDTADNNMLDGNTAGRNIDNGILVEGGFFGGNMLDGNTATNNVGNGIFLTVDSANNDLTLNKANHNGGIGIVDEGTGNTCPTTGPDKNKASKNDSGINFDGCP